MTHPIFYIYDVITYKAQNAAQEVMKMQVVKNKWLTLEDAKDIERFEAYLVDMTEHAQGCCPRSKRMIVEKEIMSNGTRRFIVKTDAKNAHTVLMVDITFIRGAWKGGIR